MYTGPPWVNADEWEEANESVAYVLKNCSTDLTRAFALAREIDESLEEIFPVLDCMCSQTCRLCPEPCCLSAKVWVDFKDMIFLHLNGLEPPEAQPLKHFKEICRYLGPKGCLLDRKRRPWICAWYLCPAQARILGKQDPDVRISFNRTIQKIKESRKAMEKEFIQALTF